MVQRNTIQRLGGLMLLTVLTAAGVWAQSTYSGSYQESKLPPNARPPQLKNVGVDEKLGELVDLNLTFIGEDGYPVKLSKFFSQSKPVILNLVYYECPQLCSLILNAQVKAMRELDWTPGNQYEIVTISIDPREHFDIAKKKKAMYLSSFDRPAPGWNFLTDYGNNAKKLADQVGFRYQYDARIEQFAHPAVIMVLSGSGKVARYLYGIDYKPQDLRFALAEASENRTSMALEKVLLFCYQYDPNANRYVLFAANFMKVGGALCAAGFLFFWWRMVRADRRRGSYGRSGEHPSLGAGRV